MLVKQILDTETGKLLVKNLSNKWVDVRVARVFFFFFGLFVCLILSCLIVILPYCQKNTLTDLNKFWKYLSSKGT